MNSKSSAELKTELVRRAREIGFDDCRVVAADPPRHAAEFRSWLKSGSAGEMDWIERAVEKRSDPQKVLPGARSIVVLALNYWQGEARMPNESNYRIARYAWGDDYHEVIETKLRLLDSFLIEAGGRQRCYVDTGPVLERD